MSSSTAATRATAYAGPRSLGDALALRAEHPTWLVLAGGTDVMVPPGPGATTPDGVLDVFSVREMHGVAGGSGSIRIGACTTYGELVASGLLRDSLPLLHDAARGVGAVQIRERGTIGGNIVTSSPVGDMLPGLLALEADVVVASVRGTRTVPYEAFVTGYRAVDLAADELLVTIDVPRPLAGTVQHWRKVGTRAAQSIAKVSLAATARLDGPSIACLRLALGGVADRPVRLHEVERLGEGQVPGGALAVTVEDAVRAVVEPITDVRSTAEYRAHVAARLVRRFVASLTPGAASA
ncbi:MAG TPA: xanthine dehydrogenase family protein subunit M [Acidimicrobiales bacterium]|nr:xanthine dehydrogenase family protein subunit M [Acidimicrobiales bacterium]